MRIWDIESKHLCRKHLLAEHRELHGIWNILTKHKCRCGYSRHPETLRWVGKQKALYKRHCDLIKEFRFRGYKHHTPLNKRFAVGEEVQKVFINTIKEQKSILKNKRCDCLLFTVSNWRCTGRRFTA
ncbi:MAG TPA: pyrimidine dimer DNA glycosylase [Elusimicrobia bacterium]|nr:pyrimidine dimer DNA glycosylase [Elusimicrobiota bacterium]